MKLRPVGPLIAVAVVLVLVPACSSPSRALDPEDIDADVDTSGRPPFQKNSLDEVKRRVRDVRVGTPMPQVMIALGSPAEKRGDQWIYMPDRSGLLIPADAVVVTFRDGRFVKYETKLIILGERL